MRIKTARQLLSAVMLHIMLIAVAFLTVFPFYWMFILATHDRSTIFTYPPPMLPSHFVEQNYQNLLEVLPFWRNVWNSAYTAIMATGTTLFFCSLAGFGFAMYDFKHKERLFAILLATIMIPNILGIIPYYLIIKWLGWLSQPRALYVPGMASAFGIFLMRQYIASAIPRDLLDAARMDGCTEFRIYAQIIVPLVKPALGTLAIITFVGSWNNFMGALVVMRSREAYTLPVALRSLQGLISTDWGALMLGSAISVLPLLIVFVFASRRIIEGLTAGATKG